MGLGNDEGGQPLTHFDSFMPPRRPWNRGRSGRDARFPPSRERRGNRCYTQTGEPSPRRTASGCEERQTFNSVPFCSISFHSLDGGTLIPAFSPQGGIRGNDGARRWRNVRASRRCNRCRWVWGYAWGGVHTGGTLTLTLSQRARGPPDIEGTDGGAIPGVEQGCEVPAFAGTTALIRRE